MESYTYPLELDEWVTNILGVSLATLDEWTNIFTERRMFEDEIVAEAITGFLGKPLQEQSLYKPFCTFGNRVVNLGREYITGLPPYPFEDLIFLRNDPHRLHARSHETKPSPDIVLTTNATKDIWPARPRYRKRRKYATSGIEWSDILFITEGRPFKSKRRARAIRQFWNTRFIEGSIQKQVGASVEVRYHLFPVFNPIFLATPAGEISESEF